MSTLKHLLQFCYDFIATSILFMEPEGSLPHLQEYVPLPPCLF